MSRQQITAAEADTIVHATGWRSAFYLEALAKKMGGSPTEQAEQATVLVEDAIKKLLQPIELPTFEVWNEHLRKHYGDGDRAIALGALTTLAKHPQGLGINALLTFVARPALTAENLRQLLMRLDAEDPVAAFRNVLLRRWWMRFPPGTT